MKTIRTLTLIGGLVIFLLAFGFIFRVPLMLGIWPWQDGRYSYLFIGSILAAVSAAAFSRVQKPSDKSGAQRN